MMLRESSEFHLNPQKELFMYSFKDPALTLLCLLSSVISSDCEQSYPTI